MRVRFKGEAAQAYVERMGCGSEVQQPDEDSTEIYFDADSEHPNYQTIIRAMFHDPDLAHLYQVKARYRWHW
jgi:hypothetical protein